MKKILIILWFFNFCSLIGKEQDQRLEEKFNPLRIYLCSRLTEAAKKWNNEICQELNKGFCIFRPQDIELSHLSSLEMDWAAYQADFEGMNEADALLVLPPYGRDCAWEIGWFCGHQKPAIAYAEVEGDWLRDAMVKGGLTAIITNNALLYKILLEDPSTVNKSYFILSRKGLGEAIKKIYHLEAQQKTVIGHEVASINFLMPPLANY